MPLLELDAPALTTREEADSVAEQDRRHLDDDLVKLASTSPKAETIQEKEASDE